MCKTEVKYTGARLEKNNFKSHTETQRRLRQPHPVTVYVTLREQCTNLFYILLTVHLDVILVNDQLDALFFNVFILCLYMFRATSAHHQEGQTVLIHHLVKHTRVGVCLTYRSRGVSSRPARQTVTHQSVL
jgi:hypothetical protein